MRKRTNSNIQYQNIICIMKRHIILLFLAFMGINAFAQDFNIDAIGKKQIDIYGSKVYIEDYELDKHNAAACFSSINGIDMSQDYLKYRKGYKVGAGLLAGGASLIVFGLGTSVVGIAELSDAIWGIGVTSVVTGTLCFLSGIPTICVYKARLNRLEKRYNTSLQVGTSSNGLSMAISF